MGSLGGKVALITGAASGIGLASSRLFMSEGASIAAVDINRETLARTVGELGSRGPIVGIDGDVTKVAEAERVLERAVSAFGRVDILFSNAGIGSVTPILDLDEEEWDRVIAINLKGMFTMVKVVAAHMRSIGGGTIVTAGSESGLVGVAETPAYCASKGGVVLFTRAVALDLIRYNIRVNCLCPGITRTPLLQAEADKSPDPELAARTFAEWAPIGRIADPSEIAKAALFLASEASSFAVGSCLVVDGGNTAR
jgi:NAD(P)-dependent dehydrogenase (short-subunit alcohol dehydrogenase family)